MASKPMDFEGAVWTCERVAKVIEQEFEVPYHPVAVKRLIQRSVLAAIGDIMRFECAKHLVGYARLGAAVHDSGQTHRGGRITKAGRRELRWALVEAAWRAVDDYPYWKREHEQPAR